MALQPLPPLRLLYDFGPAHDPGAPTRNRPAAWA